MNSSTGNAIRLLVVAPQPFRLDDLRDFGAERRYEARLIRRPTSVEDALDGVDFEVALVDTSFPDGAAYEVIGEIRARSPETGVIALTPDPPPHDQVAQAIRAGAVGFVDIDAQPEDFAAAIEAVRRGDGWMPSDETRQILSAVADDLELTSAERRSRLTNILLGLIPLTGAMAALLAFTWRRYLGHIGVRPVDLDIDPATRVVDALTWLLFVVGFFGPLLLIGSWLDLLGDSAGERGVLARSLKRRRLAWSVIAALWLGVAVLLTLGPDLVLVLFIGPVVAVAIVARALDLSDELPRFLRIQRIKPARALVGGLVALLLFVGVLAVETVVVGPEFDEHGAHGFIAPTVLGFKAIPVRATNVESGDTRQVLYLGGNADLYVLVDPCADDEVAYVSVGSTRLDVIDAVACRARDR